MGQITGQITGRITGKDGGSEEAQEEIATLVASARAQAIRLLARRDHSRKELRAKLAARGHARAVIEDVVDALNASGLQSDRRFAEAYVHSALNRGQGERKIRAGLAQRGIESSLAAEFLTLDEEHWQRLATTALAKRFGEGPAQGVAEQHQRFRFLAGRGFAPATACRVCA